MVKVENFAAFSEEEIKLCLATHALDVFEPAKVPPPSPGEEEGKDGTTAELLAALRKRLRESEKTISKLREEIAVLKTDKNASDEEVLKCRAESQELRLQLAAASSTDRKRTSKDLGFGYELEEQERLADYVSELEHERIVLTGMYRSASKRCQMLEQRLAARAQAAINMAKMEGRKIAPLQQPVGDESVKHGDDELDEDDDQDGENREGAGDGREGLWDAPDEEETGEDDCWRRGDWGHSSLEVPEGGPELTFKHLPLEQCRQLVTNSANKLRVEDWVIRHACQCQRLGEYQYEPDLEGGRDSEASCSSSSREGPLLSLSISSSCGSGWRAHEATAAEGDAKFASVDSVVRQKRRATLREELKGYSSMQVKQVRAHPITGGGVTRAAWKTGSFATPTPHLFNSLMGATHTSLTPEKAQLLEPASIVAFGT